MFYIALKYQLKKFKKISFMLYVIEMQDLFICLIKGALHKAP